MTTTPPPDGGVADGLPASGVRWGRFVAGALVAAARARCGAVAAFNLLTDPWGVFGIGIFPPRVNQDRSTKADLLTELKQPAGAAHLRLVARVDGGGGAGGAGHRPAHLQRRRHRRPAGGRLRVHGGRPRHLAAGDAGLPLAARRGGVPARPAAAVAARGVAVQPLPALAGQGGGPARRARLARLVDAACRRPTRCGRSTRRGRRCGRAGSSGSRPTAPSRRRRRARPRPGPKALAPLERGRSRRSTGRFARLDADAETYVEKTLELFASWGGERRRRAHADAAAGAGGGAGRRAGAGATPRCCASSSGSRSSTTSRSST